MQREKGIKLALGVMAIMALSQVVGVKLGGVAVILGIALFFVVKRVEKLSKEESGLNFRAVPKMLKKKALWVWLLVPVAVNGLAMVLSSLFLPAYADHIVSRTASVLKFDQVDKLLIQLVVFALGEEIAWRGFFQKRLRRYLPVVPTLLITSALFAVSHISSGPVDVVVFDVVFIAINSVLYGVLFEKTNNAWVSWMAHLLANLSGVAFILMYN